jgi:hypothetical protein
MNVDQFTKWIRAYALILMLKLNRNGFQKPNHLPVRWLSSSPNIFTLSAATNFYLDGFVSFGILSCRVEPVCSMTHAVLNFSFNKSLWSQLRLLFGTLQWQSDAKRILIDWFLGTQMEHKPRSPYDRTNQMPCPLEQAKSGLGSTGVNYFEFLSLYAAYSPFPMSFFIIDRPTQYPINLELLQKNYYALQRQFHPDKFFGKPEVCLLSFCDAILMPRANNSTHASNRPYWIMPMPHWPVHCSGPNT